MVDDDECKLEFQDKADFENTVEDVPKRRRRKTSKKEKLVQWLLSALEVESYGENDDDDDLEDHDVGAKKMSQSSRREGEDHGLLCCLQRPRWTTGLFPLILAFPGNTLQMPSRREERSGPCTWTWSLEILTGSWTGRSTTRSSWLKTLARSQWHGISTDFTGRRVCHCILR